MFSGIYQFKRTASSPGSSMLTERVKEDVARSSVLTHEQQGQAVEESANISQEPHQDCELKSEMIITASKTVTGKSHFIDFLDLNLRQNIS